MEKQSNLSAEFMGCGFHSPAVPVLKLLSDEAGLGKNRNSLLGGPCFKWMASP